MSLLKTTRSESVSVGVVGGERLFSPGVESSMYSPRPMRSVVSCGGGGVSIGGWSGCGGVDEGGCVFCWVSKSRMRFWFAICCWSCCCMAKMASWDLVSKARCCLMDWSSVLSCVMVEMDCLLVVCFVLGLGGGRSGNSSEEVSIWTDGRDGLVLETCGPKERSTLVVALQLPIKTSR